MEKKDYYKTIQDKIHSLKETYPSLRSKPDDYVFTILCVKASFFKNPALDFGDEQINIFSSILQKMAELMLYLPIKILKQII